MNGRSVLLANVQFYSSKEGDSILVENGRIAAIGREYELRKKAKKSVLVYDCEGSFVIPGFVDAHMHMLSYASFRNQIDLRNVSSIEELKELVVKRTKKLGPKKWIIGRGWDQEKFAEERMPNRWDLDEAAPDNPVFLVRVCGHIAVVNSYALRLAKLTDNTPDPPGGVLGREDGKLNGLLYEEAIDIVRKLIGRPSFDEAVDLIASALDEAASYGLVELHAMSVDAYEYELLKYMDEKGLLKLRIKAYLEPPLAYGMRKYYHGCMLEVCGVKLFLDGSFGARTAYLRKPYSDSPDTRGILLIKSEDIIALIREADRRGLDVAVHAIGDGAIEELLKAIEKNGLANIRLEHASLTPPDIIEKIFKLKIPVSVQPHFILSDWWIVERLGSERSRWVYAFKSLLSRGITIGASSDAPVEPLNPWLGAYAAADRGLRENLQLWNCSAGEALSINEAMQIYVSGWKLARKSRKSGIAGLSINENMRADLIVIENKLPSSCNDLKNAKVKITLVDGRIVHIQKRK